MPFGCFYLRPLTTNQLRTFNANQCKWSLALLFSSRTAPPLRQNVITRTHTWLNKWVLVCPVRSDVTIIMRVQVPKVLGGCHVWLPGSSLGQLVKALHASPYAHNCDCCCRALHEAVHVWHSKAAPPPLVSSLLLSSPLLSCSETCCFFYLFFLFHTGFIYLSIPLSSLPSPKALSFSLPLPPVFRLFSRSCSRPPSTSIVEFRQAIYIFLPGCLTSHSLNKVCFIVSARVYAHSDSAWPCVCTCVAANWCVGALVGVCTALSLVLFVCYLSSCFVLWVCSKSRLWMLHYVPVQGACFSFFFPLH